MIIVVQHNILKRFLLTLVKLIKFILYFIVVLLVNENKF